LSILQQGFHADPARPDFVPPSPENWSGAWRDAYESREMEKFRDALRLPTASNIRDAVIDDLSSYYKLSADEVVQRCVDWERISVEEWQASKRETAAEIAEFYRTTTSWSFDLLWYAYLQSEGVNFPHQVAVARYLGDGGGAKRHLDFGSGVGATSQLFRAMGYQSDLADISTTLLAFARYRLERRGTTAGYVDLNVEKLPERKYDVITSIDCLTHIPDLRRAAESLHRALVPGGLLVANLDVRAATAENAWHLYDNDLSLRYLLQGAGFEPVANLGRDTIAYKALDTGSWRFRMSRGRDYILFHPRLRPAARKIRKMLRK
jgi:2-polyprenyl-3-methyl-5-hydroxy-6-metoxy-1,4-benzoquinol methylase